MCIRMFKVKFEKAENLQISVKRKQNEIFILFTASLLTYTILPIIYKVNAYLYIPIYR